MQNAQINSAIDSIESAINIWQQIIPTLTVPDNLQNFGISANDITLALEDIRDLLQLAVTEQVDAIAFASRINDISSFANNINSQLNEKLQTPGSAQNNIQPKATYKVFSKKLRI